MNTESQARETVTVKCFNCGERHTISADHCYTARDAGNTPQWEARLPCGLQHELSSNAEHALGLLNAQAAEELGY